MRAVIQAAVQADILLKEEGQMIPSLRRAKRGGNVCRRGYRNRAFQRKRRRQPQAPNQQANYQQNKSAPF